MNCLSIVMWSGCIQGALGATYIEQHRTPAVRLCCVDRAICNTHTHTHIHTHTHTPNRDNKPWINTKISLSDTEKKELLFIREEAETQTKTIMSMLSVIVHLLHQLVCMCMYINAFLAEQQQIQFALRKAELSTPVHTERITHLPVNISCLIWRKYW